MDLLFHGDVYVMSGRIDDVFVITDQMGYIPRREYLEQLRACVEHTLSLPEDDVRQYNEYYEQEKVERRERLSKCSPTRSKSYPGFLYLMKNLRNGYIKLGYSRNPEYRETTLQSEDPEVILLFKMPGSKADESVWHKRFDSKRIRGEWFNLTDQDIQELQSSVTS